VSFPQFVLPSPIGACQILDAFRAESFENTLDSLESLENNETIHKKHTWVPVNAKGHQKGLPPSFLLAKVWNLGWRLWGWAIQTGENPQFCAV
jgi:hypothetical protein